MRLIVSLMAVTAMACDAGGSTDRVTTIESLTGDLASGETVYTENCAVCHLEDGTGDLNGGVGIDLVQLYTDEPNGEHDFIGTVLNGEGDMTAFADMLDDQQIADVMAYLKDAFGG